MAGPMLVPVTSHASSSATRSSAVLRRRKSPTGLRAQKLSITVNTDSLEEAWIDRCNYCAGVLIVSHRLMSICRTPRGVEFRVIQKRKKRTRRNLLERSFRHAYFSPRSRSSQERSLDGDWRKFTQTEDKKVKGKERGRKGEIIIRT